MTPGCDICGKKISREVFNRNTTAAGMPKNKGECDPCTEEWATKIEGLLIQSALDTYDNAKLLQAYAGCILEVSNGKHKRIIELQLMEHTILSRMIGPYNPVGKL